MNRLGTLALLLAVAGGQPLAAQSTADGLAIASSPKPKPRPLVQAVVAPQELIVEPAPLPEAIIEPVAAPQAKAKLPPRDLTKGLVTNMPVPRFVTLKTNEGNARRGPGLSHRIDWVFTKAGMPLRITAEFENWRRVEDADGLGGWVHYTLLSGVRSVLVQQDMAEFHGRADDKSEVAFQAELGVVGRLLACDADWCRVSVAGEKGWVHKSALWGVEPGEIIE